MDKTGNGNSKIIKWDYEIRTYKVALKCPLHRFKLTWEQAHILTETEYAELRLPAMYKAKTAKTAHLFVQNFCKKCITFQNYGLLSKKTLPGFWKIVYL